MLVTLKAGKKESCLTPTLHSFAKHSLLFWQGNDLTDKLLHVFTSLCLSSAHWSAITPGLWDATLCSQVWFIAGFSTPYIGETNLGHSPQCRGAVGGSLRTPGRGKRFSTDSFSVLQKSCSMCLCAHDNYIWKNEF